MKKSSYSLVIGLVCLSFLASCTISLDESQEGNGRRNSYSQSSAVMGSGGRGDRPVRGPKNSSDTVIQTSPVSDSGSDMTSSVQDGDRATTSDSSTSSVEIQTTPTESSTTISSPLQSSAPITTTKSVSYTTPSHRGQTTTRFSVTTQDGIITAASATFQSGDHDDQKYQNAFSRNISSVVVGKKTSEVSLDVIGGASLTTDAFEQFVKGI